MPDENSMPAAGCPLEVAADAASIWARANAPLSDPAKFGQQVAEVYRAALALAKVPDVVALPVREG